MDDCGVDMSFLHPQELLTRAYAAGYALPSRLVRSMADAASFFDAAEASRSPAVVRLDMADGGASLAPEAARRALEGSVPVMLQGDCGDSLELVRLAAQSGCAAVGLDGSGFALEKNLAFTREAARLARSLGLWAQGALALDEQENGDAAPTEAAEFAISSGCNGLKILQQGAAEPSFQVLARLSSALQVYPLTIRPALKSLVEAGAEPLVDFGPPLDSRLTQICRLGVCVVEADELPPQEEAYRSLLAGVMARALKSAGQADQQVF